MTQILRPSSSATPPSTTTTTTAAATTSTTSRPSPTPSSGSTPSFFTSPGPQEPFVFGSSRNILTPSSRLGPGFSLSSTPETNLAFPGVPSSNVTVPGGDIRADEPLPSVEGGSKSPAPTSGSSSPGRNARTPSFSFSPLPSFTPTGHSSSSLGRDSRTPSFSFNTPLPTTPTGSSSSTGKSSRTPSLSFNTPFPFTPTVPSSNLGKDAGTSSFSFNTPLPSTPTGPSGSLGRDSRTPSFSFNTPLSSTPTGSSSRLGRDSRMPLFSFYPLPAFTPTGPSSNLGQNSRTPSISFSPPPTRFHTASPGTSPRGSVSPQSPDETESIAGRLGNLGLAPRQTSLGMSDVGAAITDVANGLDEQALQPVPPSPEPGAPSPSPRRRRRSEIVQPPHSVKDEELPPNRFHDPVVQTAFGDAKALASSLADALGSSPLHVNPDSTIQRLHRRAQDLSRFQCPSTRTVGFVGDSGVGKSSLLNSLLDSQDLARTSNSGAACTCVVTEYHYHDSKDFMIDVELFGQEDLMEQVTELLHCYRYFHEDTENTEEGKKKKQKDVEEEYKIARDTFQAMFRGRLDDEQFLLGKPVERVLSTLRSWLLEANPSNIGGRQTRSSLQECSSLLMHLTSETRGAKEPAVWPYIRKISVFLDSHILSKGLVLVDLPGLRDLNSARRKVTERFMLECDEVFAICSIGRATTDEGVSSVFELAKKAELSNVGIVCTKSEDIKAAEAKKDWKGQRATRIQQLSDAVAATQNEINNIDLELAKFEDEELMDEEKNHVFGLIRSKRNAEKARRQKQLDLKKYLVVTRNEAVIAQLHQKYDPNVPAGTLRVFCVSNNEYWEKRSRPKDEALPYLQLSCIIALRKHCLSIIAETQLREATRFAANDIPALLGEVALWVESGAGSTNAEQKRAVRETLDKIERRLKKDLTGRDSRLNQIAKSFLEDFNTHVYNNRNTGHWGEVAIDASCRWNQWAHPTYSAFCRNYGIHDTKGAGGWHNWNEEIIAGMLRDLAAPWQKLCSSFNDENEHTAEMIEESLDRALDLLETELEDFPHSTTTLRQSFFCQKEIILWGVEEACNKFEGGLSTLRIDALTGIRTSLIGKAMESSYRACNLESGTGSDRKRKKIVNDAIERHDLFQNLMLQFKRQLKTLVGRLQADLQTDIQSHLATIGTTLDLIRSENVATESERNPELRHRLEDELARAREKLGRIRQVMSS